MNALHCLLVSLFSPGQIAGIVIFSVLLAGLIGLNIYLAILYHKRGAHKMYTDQLQRQRDALMKQLDAMRSGSAVSVDLNGVRHAVGAEIPEAEEAEEEAEVAQAVEEEAEEEELEGLEVEVNELGKVVRYNRSFTARITQANNDLKARYSELKNYLLSFEGITARMSWKRETFGKGRRSVASLSMRGKTLCLCLATEASLFENTKYKVEELPDHKKNALPCLYRITSDRRTGYAKEMIVVVMAGFGTRSMSEYEAQDFTLPYKSTEVLVKQHLIKIVGNAIPEAVKEDAVAATKGITYNRSFTARMIQSNDLLKARYSKIKNYLMSHEGMQCSDTWKQETFRSGRSNIAALAIRGKTLCLMLAIEPETFEGTKFKVEDLSVRNKRAPLPLMYRIKNDRRVGYAKQLIDFACVQSGIEKIAREEVNYAVPFTATETLIRRGLIRVSDRDAAPDFAAMDATAKEDREPVGEEE